MATATVTYTANNKENVAYYTDGKADWQEPSLGKPRGHEWTVEQIEADLAKTHKGATIEIMAID